MIITMLILMSFSVIALYCYGLRNTVFGFSLARQNYIGFFHFFTLIIWIIPGVFFINIFPLSYFNAVYDVTYDSLFPITCWIFYALFLFYLTLTLFSSNLRLYRVRISNVLLSESDKKRIILVVYLIILILLMLLAVVYFRFGITNAFFDSIIHGTNLSYERTIHRNAPHFVSLFSDILHFMVPFLSALIALPVYKRKTEKVILLLLLMYFSTFMGDKSPLLIVFIVYFLVYITVNNKKIISTLPLIALIIFIFPFLLLLLKLSGIKMTLNNVVYFLANRLLGQIVGVYTAFNLDLHNSLYFTNGVPFYNIFGHASNFQKDLMLVSENISNRGTIGIKNTLFIAEAKAGGGVLLLLISPVLMALSWMISYKIIFSVYRFLLLNDQVAQLVTAISLFSYLNITGGFFQFILLKTITLMLTFLLPISGIILLLKSASMRRRN